MQQVGLLHGAVHVWKNSDQHIEGFPPLAFKAEYILEKWKNEYNKDHASTGQSVFRDVATPFVEKIISDIRLCRYERMKTMEVDFAQGFLHGIYSNRIKDNLSDPIIKRLKETLHHHKNLLTHSEEDRLFKFTKNERMAIILLALGGIVAFLGHAVSPSSELSPQASEIKQRLNNPNRPHRTSREDQLNKKIESYEQDLLGDLALDDSAAIHFALANIHADQTLNYAEAVMHYQQILSEHPEWERIKQVNSQLELCLKRLDDNGGA